MNIRLNIILLTGFLAFFGANSCSLNGNDQENSEVVNMRINHFQQTGFGAFPQLVYLVQEGEQIGGHHWDFFYDQIEGFDYELGYIYELKVKKEKVENPPQDASEINYLLQSVISKEKIPEDVSFDVKLKWGGNNFVENTAGTYSIMGEIMIDCSDLCAELSERLENDEELTGTFIHGGENTLELRSIQ